MRKVLVDFDVISYRNLLISLKKQADHEYLKNKGTLTGMSYESMRNAFDIALDSMEDFAVFERVNNQ